MTPVVPTVFVVDDDDGVRDGLSLLLATVGQPCELYESGQEFLDAYDEDRRGCLVLDIRMPRMTGLDLQAKLNEMGSRLPIIFITGHGDIPMAVEAMRRGALDFDAPMEGKPDIYRLGWCQDYPHANNWVHEVFNPDAGANRITNFQRLTDSINLSRLVIIATDSTASAPELVTNGMEPWAEVVIGARQHLVKPRAVFDLVLSSGCSAYDCEYVALARLLGVPLVTEDRKLLRSFPDIAEALPA